MSHTAVESKGNDHRQPLGEHPYLLEKIREKGNRTG